MKAEPEILEELEENNQPSIFWRIIKWCFKAISAVTLFILKNIWEVFKPFLGWLVVIIKNQIKKHPAGAGSITMHIMLVALLVSGIPDIFRKKPEETLTFVPLEMLPIREIDNVKPEEKKEEAKKTEKEEIKESPVKKVYAKPEYTEEKKEPLKIEEKPKVEEKKLEVRKKPDKLKVIEKKPLNKEEKMPEEDFDSVLRSVEKFKNEPAKKKPSNLSQNYDPTKPLSMSEVNAIKKQISGCWSIPMGAKDAENMAVILRISLAQDGSAKSVKIVDQSRYNSDTFFRAAADSALRAVYKCSPLKGLPQDKYTLWGEMEISFDPKDML